MSTFKVGDKVRRNGLFYAENPCCSSNGMTYTINKFLEKGV